MANMLRRIVKRGARAQDPNMELEVDRFHRLEQSAAKALKAIKRMQEALQGARAAQQHVTASFTQPMDDIDDGMQACVDALSRALNEVDAAVKDYDSQVHVVLHDPLCHYQRLFQAVEVCGYVAASPGRRCADAPCGWRA